tara:strand:+ start:1100 stop:1378 length:279 start_codon:yes stop_codon:yes gene_type:complete
VSYKLTRLISPKNKVKELCEYIFRELNKYYDSTFLKLRNFTKTCSELRIMRKQLSMRTCVEIEHSFIYFLTYREQPKATVKSQKIELNYDTQ